VDVQEVRKLDAYLKRLFGNARIRIVPKEEDTANVFVGDERVGHLSVDDEDDERSYNLEMKITMGEPINIKTIKSLETYLRRRFDNEAIKVSARPRKTDSAEVNIGDEYIGVLFFDDKDTKSCFFEMAILGLDLDEAGQ
jgi:hypothetical protein